MVWYNPFSWFSQSRFEEHPDSVRLKGSYIETFYCANPECHKPIQGNLLMYDPSQRVLVHEGDCQILFVAHSALHSRKFVTGNFDPLSRKEAIDLVHEGKINALCLEKRV